MAFNGNNDPLLNGEEQPEGQPTGSSIKMIASGILVVAIAVLFVPLLMLAHTLDDSNATLGSELAATSTALAGGSELDAAGTPQPGTEQEGGLSVTVDALRANLNALEPAQATFAAGQYDWTVVMPVILNYEDSALVLTELKQAEQNITLEGVAKNEDAVIDYARRLEESGLFRRVIIQSLSIAAEPFGTVQPTATPTFTPVPTATDQPTPSSPRVSNVPAGSEPDSPAGQVAYSSVLFSILVEMGDVSP